MLTTPHILVGGAIGKQVKSPYAALPLAFASHFMLDAVPHVDVISLLGFGGPKSDLVTAAEVLVGAALLLILVRGQKRMRWILRGAMAAIAMDAIVLVTLCFPVIGGWPGLSHLCWLHGFIGQLNPNTGRLLGLATQAPAVILPIFLLCRYYARSDK